MAHALAATRIVVALGALCVIGALAQTGCKPLPSTLSGEKVWCHEYLPSDFQIADDADIAQLDAAARVTYFPVPQCTYYARGPYSCRRQFKMCNTTYVPNSFPHCLVLSVIGHTFYSPSQTALVHSYMVCPPICSHCALYFSIFSSPFLLLCFLVSLLSDSGRTLLPMCGSVCLAGEYWSQSGYSCDRAVGHADIVAECSNTTYYGTAPNCYTIVFPEPSNDSSTWKWIVAGTMIGVGVLILLALLISYIRKRRMNPEITDEVIAQPFEHEVTAMKAGKWTGAMPPVNSSMDNIPTNNQVVHTSSGPVVYGTVSSDDRSRSTAPLRSNEVQMSTRISSV